MLNIMLGLVVLLMGRIARGFGLYYDSNSKIHSGNSKRVTPVPRLYWPTSIRNGTRLQGQSRESVQGDPAGGVVGGGGIGGLEGGGGGGLGGRVGVVAMCNDQAQKECIIVNMDM